MSASSPRPGYRFAGLPIHLVVVAEQTMRALERNDSGRALSELDRVAEEMSGHPELLRLRGLTLMQLGEFGPALEAFMEAAELAPGDALIACQLGAALAQNGDMPGAEESFRRAIDLDPDLPDAWYNLGHALDARTDTQGALLAFERVLALKPQHVAARVQRAEMLKIGGRLDEAELELRTVLAHDPDSVAAWVGMANLKTFRPSAVDLDRLVALHAGGHVPQARRIDFSFALASLLEGEQRYVEAYRLFEAANKGKRKGVRWNAAAVSGLVDDILQRFGALPPVASDTFGSEAIFLVGMPRSGSTLAEQILSAHADVQGGGERNEIVQILQDESRRRGMRFPEWVADADDADWRRLGNDYLSRCAAWRDQRPRFTNKTLTNWQTLGAIRRMLPGAHVVHCLRDPLETLWSCYKHHFGEAQFFTYDMEELVAFWRDETRAMRTWTHAWPDWIHPFVHENLLDAPEASIRALLAQCTLSFDSACLSFHENMRDVRTSSATQVRQPLRRDLAVAQRYGSSLEPLRSRLLAASAHDASR
jgi:tetratricopeptide (TPR) repeat protein